jgi:hypothetical protein
MTSAHNSAQMKYAKAELDGCIAEMKQDIGTEDADKWTKLAMDEMVNAKLSLTWAKTHPLPEYT